jgi:hypothetical protein
MKLQGVITSIPETVKGKTQVHHDNKVTLCSFQGHQIIAHNTNLYQCQDLKYYC